MQWGLELHDIRLHHLKNKQTKKKFVYNIFYLRKFFKVEIVEALYRICICVKPVMTQTKVFDINAGLFQTEILNPWCSKPQLQQVYIDQ